LDHTAKAAVLVGAPSADAEERRARIGRPRPQRLADIGSDLAVDMGLEIIPVRKIDVGCGHDEAVGERMALGVENPGRFYLRQGIRKLLEPQMQGFLAGDDAGIGDSADDLGDFRQGAVDGFEHFQRVFVRDIQRALDLAVGGLLDRNPGDSRRKGEQCQRKGH
jgi:hypothetical protein